MINGKKNISAIDLQKLIQADVNAIKEVIADLASVVIGVPYWHETDGAGCNWDISNVKNIAGYESSVAEIVRKYMLIYSLPNP